MFTEPTDKVICSPHGAFSYDGTLIKTASQRATLTEAVSKTLLTPNLLIPPAANTAGRDVEVLITETPLFCLEITEDDEILC